MSYELSGKLIELYETVQVSENFKKREFVVEKVEQGSTREFIEQIKFQVTQDRCDILDGLNINDEVKVAFNIRGRKWEKEGRVNYFTNLDAWRVEKAAQEGVDAAPAPAAQDTPPPEAPEFNDDLPF